MTYTTNSRQNHISPKSSLGICAYEFNNDEEMCYYTKT